MSNLVEIAEASHHLRKALTLLNPKVEVKIHVDRDTFYGLKMQLLKDLQRFGDRPDYKGQSIFLAGTEIVDGNKIETHLKEVRGLIDEVLK